MTRKTALTAFYALRAIRFSSASTAARNASQGRAANFADLLMPAWRNRETIRPHRTEAGGRQPAAAMVIAHAWSRGCVERAGVTIRPRSAWVR